MLRSCCTLSVGGRVFITPEPLPKAILANEPCWIMCDSTPANNILQGLRSQEVLDLNREDLLLPEAQIRVPGKGSKIRFLPLAPEAIQLLDHYLRLERPRRG